MLDEIDGGVKRWLTVLFDVEVGLFALLVDGFGERKDEQDSLDRLGDER